MQNPDCDQLTIGGCEVNSRLFLGTGKYSADRIIPSVVAAAGLSRHTSSWRKAPPLSTAMARICSRSRLPAMSPARVPPLAQGSTLREAALALGVIGAEDFDRLTDPARMVG